jgi:trehalose 6-phosphate phosphatase
MKDLLLPRHRSVLTRLLAPAKQPILLAFDYDGVLAPLVEDHRGVSMSPATRALLQELTRRYPVAVVSGRSFARLHQVVGAVVPYLVGNHGVEHLHRAPVPAAVLAEVRRWEKETYARLEGVQGFVLEHKHSTFTVHWAGAHDHVRTGRAVLRAVRALRGVRVVPAKNAVNVLPAGFPTKGDAVRRLLSELGCRRALFLGDDITDEYVFTLPERLALGVHVGRGPTCARWYVPGRAGVDELLELILRLSPAPGGRGARVVRTRAGSRR